MNTKPNGPKGPKPKTPKPPKVLVPKPKGNGFEQPKVK